MALKAAESERARLFSLAIVVRHSVPDGTRTKHTTRIETAPTQTNVLKETLSAGRTTVLEDEEVDAVHVDDVVDVERYLACTAVERDANDRRTTPALVSMFTPLPGGR